MYTGNSIVDYLKSVGQDSSYANRAQMAAQLGIGGYRGTAEQNLQMLSMLRSGQSPTSGQPTGVAQSSTLSMYENELGRVKDLSQQHEAWLTEQRRIQEEQINKQTAFQESAIERQKGLAEEDLEKEGRAAHVDYLKSIDPYGVEREQLAAAGLGHGGYSESVRTQHYNTMQNRITEAIKVTRKIKADFDEKIIEARMQGDRLKAQVALEELNQKMSNMWQTLEMELGIKDKIAEQKRYEEQLAYQKEQDRIAQANLERQLAQQRAAQAQSQSNWEKQFAYQQQQDALAMQIATQQNKDKAQQDALTKGINPKTGTVNKDLLINGKYNSSLSFSNGYQPNNVKGNKLSSTGSMIMVNGREQNVWKTTTGGILGIGAKTTYYYWDGSANKYVVLPSSYQKQLGLK